MLPTHAINNDDFEPLARALQALDPHTQYLSSSSSTDNNSIEKADEDLARIMTTNQVAIHAIAECVERTKLTLSIRRNGLSPTYRLTNETLSFIFEFAECSFDNSFQLLQARAPLNLCHVSKRWRDVALNNPRLWTKIDVLNAPLVRLYIERSKNTPLEIDSVPASASKYRIHHLHPLADRLTRAHERLVPCLPSLLAVLSPHVHRLKSFRIHGLTTERLGAIITLPAPALEELYIHGGSVTDSGVCDLGSNSRLLFGGHTPSLCRIELTLIGLALQAPMFRGLTYLRIEGSCYGRSTMTGFFDTLAACPLLTFLCLSVVWFPLPHEPTKGLIELAHLETLQLFYLYGPILSAIMNSIRVPRSVNIAIETDETIALGDILPQPRDLIHRFPSLLRVVALAIYSGPGVILSGYDSRDLQDDHHILYISLSVCDGAHLPSRRRFFLDLGVDLLLPNLESLTLLSLNETCCFSVADFAAALGNMPAIKSLTLNSCSPRLEKVLIATPGQYVCPRLEILEFHKSEIGGACLDAIIQSRTRVEGMPRGGRPEGTWGTCLERVKLKCCPGVSWELLLGCRAFVRVDLEGVEVGLPVGRRLIQSQAST